MISIYGYGGGTVGHFNHGISIENARILGENGDVRLFGEGGTSEGGLNHGVVLRDAAILSAGPAGSFVTIEGYAGGEAGAASGVGFVTLEGSVGNLLASESGRLTIVGAGGTGEDGGNHGVELADVIVTSMGGDVHVHGTARSTVGNENHGIVLVGDPENVVRIQSGDGNVYLYGRRGGGADSLHLDNRIGPEALATASGRWEIHLPTPANNNFGGLVSGNTPFWGRTFTPLPGDITGHRYAFEEQPELVLGGDFSTSKVYGDVLAGISVPGEDLTLAGFVDASAFGNVWVQGNASNIGLSGFVLLSSPGAAAEAEVGSYPFETSTGALSNSAGYAFTQGPIGTLQVTPRPLQVTIDDLARVYGDANPVFTAQVTGGSLAGHHANLAEAGLVLTSSADELSKVGTYAIILTGTNPNYALNVIDGELTIEQRALTVLDVVGQGRVYDGTDIAGLDIDYEGLVDGDVVGFSYDARFSDKDVGAHKPITVSELGLSGKDAGNYLLVVAPSVLEGLTADIEARTIEVTALDATRTYGDEDPLFGFIVGGMGLAEGDTIDTVFTGALERAPGEDTGTYAIGLGTLTPKSNYEIGEFIGAKLTITPAAILIVVHDQARAQGEASPELTYSIEGLRRDDTPDVISGLVVETEADEESGPGAYPIVAFGAEAQNYVFNYAPGTLVVYAAQTEPPIGEQDQRQTEQLLYGNPGDEVMNTGQSQSLMMQLTDEGLVAEVEQQGPTGQDGMAIEGVGAAAPCSTERQGAVVISSVINIGANVYCTSSVAPGAITE